MVRSRGRRCFRWGILLAAGLIYTYAALRTDSQWVPDEVMRYQLPHWILEHGALPIGNETELIDNAYGFSYAFRPYLSSLIAVVFMKLVSLFTASEQALLVAARMVSVLSGVGCAALSLDIGDRCFRKNWVPELMACLTAFWPQVMFLSSYHNNDIFALLCSFLILDVLLRGRDSGWKVTDTAALGLSTGICLLSYYNAYGWIPVALVWCLIDCIRQKKSASFFLKRAALAAGVALLVAGWYFVRNAVIYHGDILGSRTMAETASAWEAAGHSINHMVQPVSQGLSLWQMLTDGTWVQTTIRSLIGLFGNMSAPLPLWLYGAYLLVIALLLLFALIGCIREKQFGSDTWLLFAAAVIPVVLSVIYSYTGDYQPQGRYLMPALPVLVLWMTKGAGRISRFRHCSRLPVAALVIWLLLFSASWFGTFLPYLSNPSVSYELISRHAEFPLIRKDG